LDQANMMPGSQLLVVGHSCLQPGACFCVIISSSSVSGCQVAVYHCCCAPALFSCSIACILLELCSRHLCRTHFSRFGLLHLCVCVVLWLELQPGAVLFPVSYGKGTAAACTKLHCHSPQLYARSVAFTQTSATARPVLLCCAVQQYMEQIQADPHVCAINGSQPPAPKRQRTAQPPAAPAPAARPAVQQKPKPKPPSRLSEPGYAAPLPPAPPPAPVVTYGLPNRMAPHEGEPSRGSRRSSAATAATAAALCWEPTQQQQRQLVCRSACRWMHLRLFVVYVMDVPLAYTPHCHAS
jgi:hypothetical protein